MPPDLRSRGLAYIRGYVLPDGIEIWPGAALTTDAIADSFCCFLASDYASAQPDTLSPRASRRRGAPHLPAGLEWAAGTYFEAQLDFAEIAAFELWDFFPREGTAYIFFDPGRSDFRPCSDTAARLVHTLDDPLTLASAPALLPQAFLA